jgi:hypothetical protein
MARKRRRSRARENPLELLPFLLLLGGAAAAVGTTAYVATRPKKTNAPNLGGGSNPNPTPNGPSVPLSTNTYYWIYSASPAGLPATPDDLALQMANAGWANVAVFYYGPTSQGSIPAGVSVNQGGYVAKAMWVAVANNTATAGSLLMGVPPGFSVTPTVAATPGISAVAIYGGVGPNSPVGPTGQGPAGPHYTGTPDQADAALLSLQNNSSSGGGGGGTVIDQAKGAVSNAENEGNSVLQTGQQIANTTCPDGQHFDTTSGGCVDN